MSKTKNGDMPAAACGQSWKQELSYGGGYQSMSRAPLYKGLTKREQMAMTALQGILASDRYGDFCSIYRVNEMIADRLSEAAKAAVAHADALLEELGKSDT